MCLQCAMWLCTPESTETQTQKKHTQIYIIHVCRRAEKHTQIYYTWIRKIRKNTHVLTKQARSPCSELLSRWPWSRMMPLQSTKTQNQELTSDFYVTTSKQFPLDWHCNIKTMTPRLITAYTTLPLEILTGHPYETRNISHLLLPEGRSGGQAAQSFLFFCSSSGPRTCLIWS